MLMFVAIVALTAAASVTIPSVSLLLLCMAIGAIVLDLYI